MIVVHRIVTEGGREIVIGRMKRKPVAVVEVLSANGRCVVRLRLNDWMARETAAGLRCVADDVWPAELFEPTATELAAGSG